MTIETAGMSSPLLLEYAAIPSAFDVTSVLSAREGPDGPFILAEHAVDSAYVKDYDAIGERPAEWASRFDTSQWTLFLARVEGRGVGAATGAWGTPDLDMLEGRTDLAVLWDIRVAPAFRGRGIGRALFEAVQVWAMARACRELKVET